MPPWASRVLPENRVSPAVSRVTFRPDSARVRAVTAPAMPEPMTRTSVFRRKWCMAEVPYASGAGVEHALQGQSRVPGHVLGHAHGFCGFQTVQEVGQARGRGLGHVDAADAA